ncbi:MAG TPA: type III secretion system translocator chaperone SicA [Herbaspirillum sp.]|jgi:type III secretion system low calcium response chaperone LcrH/SycD
MTVEQKLGDEQNGAADAVSGGEMKMEMLVDAVSNGITLKDVHGISNEMMDGLYAYAYDFYGKGKLDEAETFFRFLCLYDFYNIDYIMGLAAVCQMKKQYEKAIGLYAVAFGLSKNDYRPMFFTGQCHLAERKAGKARQCFELVLAHAGDEGYRAKAEVYLKVLAKTGGAGGNQAGAQQQQQQQEQQEKASG